MVLLKDGAKAELAKRGKSLAWRVGMMALAAAVAEATGALDLLNLSPGVIGLLGLVLGEVSKTLNKQLSA